MHDFMSVHKQIAKTKELLPDHFYTLTNTLSPRRVLRVVWDNHWWALLSLSEQEPSSEPVRKDRTSLVLGKRLGRHCEDMVQFFESELRIA